MYNVTIEVGNGIEASFAVDMAAVKGEQGIQGEKGDTGKGFTILGTYATVEALAAAVTDAEQGDYYNVGTEAPYRIYMWDDAEGWQDQGQLQGPTGPTGPAGPQGAPGSDASVTADNIRAALGYTPVKDVHVGGTSVLTGGVANVPIAGNKVPGVIGVDNYSMGIAANNNLFLYGSRKSDIDTRAGNIAIDPIHMDYAVKAAMCDGKGPAWTEDEQQAAKARIGIANDYTTDEKNKLAGLSAPVSLTATLTVAGWSGTTQTVSVTSVTADSILTVTYAPASHDAWLDAGVYCSAQGAGTLTFTCESVPSAALTANIVILA